MGKILKFMVFTFVENALNLGIFSHAPFSSQNTGQNFLKTCFLQQQKVVENTVICFIKIQSENMKMTWNIILYDL